LNTIPYHDFGGNGPLLHFAAPNAYTPDCFHQFIAPFLPHYHIIAMFHRPLWPGTNPEELAGDWHLFAHDLIRFLDQENITNVIGMGHSLGAVATLYAAAERPELFSKLLLVDPVFLPPQILQMAAANPDQIRTYMPLIDKALRRRNRWATRQAAFDRFRGKRVFSRWSDEVIWDYVTYSLAEDEETGEIVLRWPREWEAQIYSIPPQKVWDAISRLTHPTLAIRGTESDTLFPMAWEHWQQLQPDAAFVELPDVGHMMMMERPLLVAETILDYLKGGA